MVSKVTLSSSCSVLQQPRVLCAVLLAISRGECARDVVQPDVNPGPLVFCSQGQGETASRPQSPQTWSGLHRMSPGTEPPSPRRAAPDAVLEPSRSGERGAGKAKMQGAVQREREFCPILSFWSRHLRKVREGEGERETLKINLAINPVVH